MVNRVVKLTGRALFTIFAAVSLTFFMIRFLPGDPEDYLEAQLSQQSGMTSQQIDAIVASYTNINPDASLAEQYIDYIISTASGDLGISIWYQESVSSILADALPWTVFIMSIALFLTFVISIILGTLMAYHEGSRFDTSSTIASMFFNSVPYYVVGILLIYVLGYQWGWFPTGGRISSGVEAGFTLSFIGSALYHAALPVFSLVITGIGGRAVAMRSNSIRVLGEDYLRVARLRGIPSNRIAFNYVGRNAILPMYTGLVISFGFMFGGSIILEQIFSYPGVGYYLFGSINARDYPLLMGGFLVITIAVVIGVYFADLTYEKLDPRAGGSNQ